MKEETRTILGVVLIVAALSFYPVYLKWVSPPAQTPETSTSIAAGAASPATFSSVPSSARAEASKTGEAVPALSDPVSAAAEDVYDLESGSLHLSFSSLGGTVKRLETKTLSKVHEDSSILIDIDKGLRGSYALVFPFDKSNFDIAPFKRDKSLENGAETIAFSAVKNGAVKISKVYHLLPLKSAVELEVVFENLTNEPQSFQYELSTQMHFVDHEGAGQEATSLESGARLEKKVESKDLGAIAKKGFLKEGLIDWVFVSKKYFALVADPVTTRFERSRSVKLNSNEIANFALMPAVELAPGSKQSQAFLIYAGPKEYTVLKSYQRDYQEIFSKGFFGTFRVWLLLALQFFNSWFHNWGWSIVAITCLIKLAFTPLTHMSFESMKKMQAVQPKVKALQEKYKKNPQEMNKHVMELYKKHKVNPLGGCLPMVLQMPIFIAFYQVLYQAIELKGAPFIFWITDLSGPDKLFTLPFALPFLGDAVNVLPILMLGSMVWQQKLTPAMSADPMQAKMMMFMPVIFGFIFYNLPSGLVLYWTLNNILTIAHQLITKKLLPAVHLAD